MFFLRLGFSRAFLCALRVFAVQNAFAYKTRFSAETAFQIFYPQMTQISADYINHFIETLHEEFSLILYFQYRENIMNLFTMFAP